MNNKRIRYITTIFTLDKINYSTGLTIWDKEDLTEFIEEQEKAYGLKLISPKEESLIVVEYTNIIWNYRVYFGSYKKKFKPLIEDDERWKIIERRIISDLNMIGLSDLKDNLLTTLKNREYFEHKVKIGKQFKKYCI